MMVNFLLTRSVMMQDKIKNVKQLESTGEIGVTGPHLCRLRMVRILDLIRGSLADWERGRDLGSGNSGEISVSVLCQLHDLGQVT